MISQVYRAQVNLLLKVFPYVAKEKIFALKGGTAINLFVREMPRLSVDIDLTYLPINSRSEALKEIQEGLNRIKADIKKNVKGININTVSTDDGYDVKLNCQGPGAQIKIEVNTITRGVVFQTKLMQVVESVQEEFDKFAAINVVSFAELYGGKICAAVDRQHPRDLFDVKLLLDNEGLDNKTWDGFKVSLISHNKPINELLTPILKDQKSSFENQFAGMTTINFSYEDYEKTRSLLIETIHNKLSEHDKMFLMSFETGEPQWDLFPIAVLKDLPSIKWKLLNIKKLRDKNPEKHRQMLELLKHTLDV